MRTPWRTMLQTLLARNGDHVLAARNGRDPLDQTCSYKGTIDLLLSDVRMPELDGPTLAIALKRSRPSIKTLLISGFLGDTGITLGGEENDWAFMQKPFSMAELLRNIRQTLFVASTSYNDASPSLTPHDPYELAAVEALSRRPTLHLGQHLRLHRLSSREHPQFLVVRVAD